MRMRACAAGLLLATLAGCWFARPTMKSTWLDKLRPFHGMTGPDVVILEVSLLELPLGDRYVNQEMWTGADEQFLSPELRILQEENGFRVAMLHGRPPDRLQSMLGNERFNRNSRQRRLRSGDTTTLDIGTKLELCEFELTTDGGTQSLKLEQPFCQMQVHPVIENDNRIRISFAPQIQHYDNKRLPSISAASILPLQNHRVTDPYPALKFDVTLGSNEWVVVGARYDKPKSLGFQFFVQPEAEKPVQRLLVLRAARGDGGVSALPVSKPDSAASDLSLASQAALGR
jgi:hypothetical protein